MLGRRSRRAPGRFTAADLLLVLALAVGAFLLPGGRGGGKALRVEVVAGGRVVAVLPLDRDGVHRVAGELGESVFEIAEGGVAMRSSPCPDALCVRQGRRSRPGDTVVCVPNGVALVLQGEGEVDVVTR